MHTKNHNPPHDYRLYVLIVPYIRSEIKSLNLHFRGYARFRSKIIHTKNIKAFRKNERITGAITAPNLLK